jgi:Fe2+ or Zn2+ uptake regulation protein
MNKICPQHTTESKQQLKTSGLKITSARLDLLDILKHAKAPLSIKEIAKRIGSNVDLVTLYRNIQSLQTLGAVKQINLKDKQAYFELTDAEHHHHITCVNCGKIVDVKLPEPALNNSVIKKLGFAKIIDHSLEFFGICNKCKNN